MSIEYKFTLPYPPSTNRIWRMNRGTVCLTDEVRKYKHMAGKIAKVYGVKVLHGDVGLELKVYRPRKSGDLSNRLKVLEDSLIGIAYIDDSQITEIVMRRYDDKEKPRVEVRVYELI